ncbi:DUF4157 domain-containing protein [Nocardioides humi]|uniref:DUF4157 domain-containing protein n=2 Tax=Nocardioides humi TaxID=449461 RepID=A0ABN2B1I2_9ACTN
MDHAHADAEPELDASARTRQPEPDPLLAKAAAAGRLDVAGPRGVIGLQRTAGNAATAQLMEDDAPPVQEVVGGGGSALDTEVRADMEARMGQDFSDVRVHTDAAADSSARSVSAHAYTVGSDIVFQRGAYDPSSTAGRTLLAHELTHVVQQRNGPVEGTPVGGGVSVSDPSDRFEREASANAEAVMGAPAPVQREAAEEEEELPD